jgi:diguanylate cyclase (GGDEF)-like protein/PAS domain S-box-containing protein
MGLANGASPVDHVPLLLATGQRFVATADQPARVPAILLEAACSVPADVAALWLADPDGQLVVAGVRHRDPLSAAALRAVLTSGDRVRPPGLVTWVHRRSRGLAAQVGTARPGMVPTRLLHYLEDNGFGTVMLTPVPGERGGLGVLATARRRDGGQFAKHERDLLQALACRAGLALETGRLQSMLRAHGAILENVADVVVAVDSSGRVAMWNHSAEHLYGAPSGSAIGSALQELIPETEFEGVAQRVAFGEAVRDGRWSGRIRQRMPNGHRIHLDVDLLVPRGPAGDLRGYVLVGRPAGAVVTGAGGIGTADPAGQQDRFARDLMEALDGRAAVLDTEGRVVVANRRWSADVGGRDRCSCGPVPEGTNWLAALHAAPGPDIAFFAREVASVLAGQRSLARIECRCLGGGPDRSTAVDVVQLTDERLGAVVVESDVSWRRRLEDELTHRATHDELTGLPNRYALMDSLEASLRRLRGPDKLAVFFCDLDGFKDINDGLGHAVGDQVLVAVARKLRRRCRQADIVSRFGGDEFVIVLPIAEVGQAVAMARRLVETLEEAIVVGDVEVAPGGSIGVRVVDRMPDGDDPVGLLLRDADTAMYHAKERGRGRYEFFDSRLRDNIAERLEMVAALRRATIDDELRVRYQAWRQCGDRRLVGVEGLVVWNHPLGTVGPASFMPIAERTGRIVEVGGWALRRALTETAPLVRERGVSVAVNVSPRQLAAPAFVPLVAEALERSGTPAERVVLEITEGALVEDPDAARAVLTKLRGLGVSIALDDFGTGWSSLSYLRRLPVDIIKIDRSFIADLSTDPDACAVVSAVLHLGHGMGLRVVAEGVERADQLEVLREMGCDEYQGFIDGLPGELSQVVQDRSLPGPDGVRPGQGR